MTVGEAFQQGMRPPEGYFPCRKGVGVGIFAVYTHVIREVLELVSNRQDALRLAAQTHQGLEKIYGHRLRGVYLYGSAARGTFHEESDIDIAIILDEISNRFDEHERTSKLGSDISLQENMLVSFIFLEEADFEQGRFSIHRSVKRDGIPV